MRGPAVEIVKRMNLEEEMRARNTTEVGTVFVDAVGKSFARFSQGEAFTANYEILRGDLAEMFLDATRQMKNVRYTYGDSITSLKQTEKAVDVTFASGSSGTYDVVVAADGATSKVRAMILDEHTLRDSYHPLGMYIAYFSIPKQADDQKLWYWYNTPRGLCMMTRPHRNNATLGTYLTKTLPARGQDDAAFEAALNNPDDAKRLLRETFQNEGWQAARILDGMDTSTDFYISRGAQVKLPKWTANRALVIGDAATATFGIGTSLAIESAYVLAGELSKVTSTADVPRALEAYEQVFRQVYEKSEDDFTWFPQCAFPQSRWGLWLRDTFLWLVSRSKVYRWLPDDDKIDWKVPDYDWRALEEAQGQC